MSMKEILWKTKCMGKEPIDLRMGMFMKEIGQVIEKKDKVLSNMMMVMSMLESG